ncbi:hypothetical protein OJE16_06580 [Pantoea tagorei]|uniref:hypothetical protein n=1 Tax=Pantoea TaxID=53335 RepID=UPI0011B02915|nr:MULTISPECIES: hypothetical protein [Pantoea]MCG7367035.1 hypothetical protein [Pantoea sp. ACRSH]MCG7397418.1 hypothetical protein [Pantoea sp. ACRSC]UBN54906.1 hypothetical protein LB453_04840 [Pantoea agglomerans]
MRPDITNAIAALLLLRISVKSSVSPLFAQANRLLAWLRATPCAPAAAAEEGQKGPASAAKTLFSFSVNFQPV